MIKINGKYNTVKIFTDTLHNVEYGELKNL